MVGEMRDHEQSPQGLKRPLPGTWFSAPFTQQRAWTIVRLLDMGMDPFNFADALLGVLAQRLVRTLCKSCREPYHPAAQNTTCWSDPMPGTLTPWVSPTRTTWSSTGPRLRQVQQRV